MKTTNNSSISTSRISSNMAWGFVLAGGIVECFWASGLKYSDNVLLYTLTGLGILFSFVSMIVAIQSRRIEIGVAYSVFVGIGTVGIATAEIMVFGEPFSLPKIGLILLLLVGVIGLKLSTSEAEEKQEETLVQHFSEDLGIDELQSEITKQIDASTSKDSNLQDSNTRDSSTTKGDK